MKKLYYVGLDIHKTIISYCIKTAEDKKPIAEGKLAANHRVVLDFFESLTAPFIIGMEATMFTGWIYDLLVPLAQEVKVAHPEMLKAITVSKKKNDRLDAEKICDLLKYKMLPECYMAPQEQRNLRRILRYRNMIVGEAVRMKNKVSGLLMEVGVEYAKKRLHGQKYFEELLQKINDVPDSVIELLQLSRQNLELFQNIQKMDQFRTGPIPDSHNGISFDNTARLFYFR